MRKIYGGIIGNECITNCLDELKKAYFSDPHNVQWVDDNLINNMIELTKNENAETKDKWIHIRNNWRVIWTIGPDGKPIKSKETFL